MLPLIPYGTYNLWRVRTVGFPYLRRDAYTTKRGTIGRAYASIGEHRLADIHLRRAVELIDGVPDYDPTDFYTVLWATTHVGFRLDKDDAFAFARRAHEVAVALMSADHLRLADLVDRFAAAIDRQEIDEAQHTVYALHGPIHARGSIATNSRHCD